MNADKIRYIVIMCHYRTKSMIFNKIYGTMLFDGTTVERLPKYYAFNCTVRHNNSPIIW